MIIEPKPLGDVSAITFLATPALAYATVTGIATEPEALRAVGWSADAVGLRHLRDELRGFLRSALTP